MITPISTLKRRFANFLKPTQEHFWSWMDSYWHKDENIPMNKVEGLSTALEGTASAEQLRNHLTDSQAHSGLFDRKVDKEVGKTLTSNDYTNEEKRTNQANAQKRVVGLTVTGDVNKIITITFADGTAIQAPFTDNDTLPENLADIKLNSLNFNDQTGVLTGVRSDGQQLTVSLDGRYSLLGHTHPEYALRTHRHHWDNIDGIPALATEGKIQEAIGKIQVGGRNLLRNSRRLITNDYYGIANYVLTEELKVGDLFTITLKGRLGEGKRAFALYDQFGIREQCALFDKGGGIYQNTFNYNGYGNSSDKMILTIFVYDNSVIVNSTIEWVKLERGNTPTDWSPAPEDILEQRTIYVDSTTFNVTADVVGKTVHINRDCTINYNDMPLLSNICFRKVYDGGQITFNGGGTLRYTGDTVFNGNNGSTAVLDMSVDINRIYIDIRNV